MRAFLFGFCGLVGMSLTWGALQLLFEKAWEYGINPWTAVLQLAAFVAGCWALGTFAIKLLARK